MEPLFAIIGVILALLAGLAVGWLLSHRTHAPVRDEVGTLRERCARNEADLATHQERSGAVTGLRAMLDEVTRERDAVREEAASLRPVAERAAELSRSLDALRSEKEELAAAKAAFERGEAERARAHAAQLAGLQEMETKLEARFGELAGRAVEGAHEAFLKRAGERMEHEGRQSEAKIKALLQPVETTLKRYEDKLGAVEKERVETYAGLREQVDQLRVSHTQARDETRSLVHALRSDSKARGNWGELSLRNVLERAGLSAHADFRTEVSVKTDEDKQLRPDVVVRLPGGRQLIIDAKCSFNAYHDAHKEADDTARNVHLKAHAAAIRRHAEQLGSKGYWQQFSDAAEYVIMFIPGEHFLSAALEQDNHLWEAAYERRVLLATPTNLVAIARTVATVWRQETLVQEAEQIGKLGKELHARLRAMIEHLGNVGDKLGQATAAYNSYIGSLETRVLPQARKFEALKITEGREVESLRMVETSPRPLTKLTPPEVQAAE